MASYTQSSDLITHYSPSQYHPKSSNTAAVYDKSQKPMVFSISSDSSELMLTKADPKTGNNRLTNLSALFGLKGQITHITATQDESSKIYVVFAEASTTGRQTPNVHICAATSPDDWESPTAKSVLIPALAGTPSVAIERLCLLRSADGSDFFEDSTYPLVMALFNIPETNTPQIQRIRVATDDDGNAAWSFVENELTLTVNPLHIIDLTVLSPRDGTICLATISIDEGQIPLLDTANYDTNYPDAGQTTTRLVAPDGAAALSTLQNADGYHDLLVAGNGLFHFRASDLSKSKTAGTNLTPNDPFFRLVQNMTTSQSQSLVTVWAQTSSNVVNNIITVPEDSSKIPVASGAAPIIPGVVQSLTPMFHAANQSHMFLYLDESGNHNLLRHKPTNDVWDNQLWILPEVSGTMQAITGYISYISFISADGRPASNKRISITASDITSVELNGIQLSLGPSPVSATTDSNGDITIIIPTSGLGGSNIITLSMDGIELSPKLDPGQPAKARIGAATGLENVKLPDGSPLVDPSVGMSLIKDASEKVSALHARLSSVPADGSIEKDSELPGGFFDDFWVAFHWIEKQEKKAEEWIRNEEGHIIAFIIELEESGPVKFLVNSIERVVRAIEWVVNFLKVEIDNLIEWLGFFFDWKDIEKQKRDMVQLVNSTTNQIAAWADVLAADAVSCVDEGIQMLETVINHLRNPSSEDFAAALTTGISKQTSHPDVDLPQDANGVAQTAYQGTGVNWSRYQLTHGNILSGAIDSAAFPSRFINPVLVKTTHPYSRMIQFQIEVVEGAQNGTSGIGELNQIKGHDLREEPPFDFKIIEDFVTDIIEPASNAVEQAIYQMVSDLKDIANGPLDGIGQRCINLIIDAMEGILTTLRTVIDGSLKIFTEVFNKVLDSIVNDGIQIPFLSTLYHFFTGDSLPSMLEILCLLTAIPSSVLGKVIAGSGKTFWPDLTGFAATLSSINVPDISSCLKTIISDVEGTGVGAPSSYAKASPRKNKSTIISDSETDWSNYSTACTSVHPIGVMVEICAETIEFLAEDVQGTPFLVSQLVANVAEWLTCAFSFPNQSAAVVSDRSESKNANILTCVSWALRVTEAMVASVMLLWLKNHSEGGKGYSKFKAFLDIIGSGITFIFSLAACSLREVANKKDLEETENTDPEEYARLKKEGIAIGIEFGNTFSSALEQFLSASGDLLPEKETVPLPAILIGLAISFARDDFGLDVGRGWYQFANGLIYRPVLF